MKRLFAFPRLLRLPNLAIVFLSQWLPYWCVLRPAILRAGGIPVLTEQTFDLLAAATVLTTLAGYLINDYYDQEMDAVNKPNRQVVGRILPGWVALALYALALAGVGWLLIRLYAVLPFPHAYWPWWVFPGVSFLLFLYAWQLKCTPIIGNLLVAFLCGIVPIILLLPESRPLWVASFQNAEIIHEAIGFVWLYALFAFVSTLLREQVKDLEDFPGDAACGCNTFAVIKGLRYAKKPTALTGLAAIVLIIILLLFWTETGAPAWQIIAGAVFLLLPAVGASLLVYGASLRRHYRWASFLVKLMMLAGVFLLLRSWPDDPIAAARFFWEQKAWTGDFGK